MCGIAGKVRFDGRAVAPEEIAAMCATLVHRGPDDQGVWTAHNVGLGQRRLAIIDLDHRAAAPLANEDGSVWVTFNGEIYNYRDLRRELDALGHTFRSESDTEVLVHLYEAFGTRMVEKLRGMFAFAIWSEKEQRLFAARDRFGKKPFVYTRTPHAFLFASEIKALLVDDSVAATPNFHAIDEYLTSQYVPSPLTAFDGIEKLPAGHTLMCDARGNLRVERYWAPPDAAKSGASEAELAEELLAHLREAVRMRLVSDVPLGAFLSGGIDSSTVVALMAETSGRVQTFSVGFDEDEFSELAAARVVAERFGTDHHELVVRPDVANVLPMLVHHYNEPFADSSAVPTYYVSQMTRQHVTVALSGDGGDESFAGYGNYRDVLRWRRADAIPAPLRRAAASMLRALPRTNTSARIRRGAAMAAGTLPQRFRLQTTILKPEEKELAYTPKMRALLADKPASPIALPWSEEMDALDWMTRHDQSFYLPDCLMVKVDIASMANGLEVRAPLLDHIVAEFAATIPSELRAGKRILKCAMRKLLPEEILARPKQGFALPVAKWLRGELRPLLEATLLDARAASRGLIDAKFTRRIVGEHVAGKRDWSNRLWALVFLELWFREWID